MPTNRRTILRAAAALPVMAGMTSGTAFAQTAPAEAPKPAAAPPEVTKILAHYIVTSGYDDLPANVRKEGVRTMLNWVGVAIGGSHHQTVDIAASALGAVLRSRAGLAARPQGALRHHERGVPQRRREPHLRL